MKVQWTKELLAFARETLKKTSDLRDALDAISQRAETRVSDSALRHAFLAANMNSPIFYLKKPDLHPLDAREVKREQDKQKEAFERLADELAVQRERTRFADEALKAAKTPPQIIPVKAGKTRQMTAVVMASDWHVEEPVEAESVAFRNEYNLEIAAKRIERFFKAIVWNVEHHRASGRILLNELVLWLGGDLITGYIHPELVEVNALSPTETVRWLLPRLRDGIATLLAADLSLTLPCSFGNHGRTTDKPRVSSGYANSYEWLMYHVLADELRNEKRVRFEITNSPHQYVEVYGRTLHFTHGDEVKYQGGIGGLGIPLLKAVPMWDRIKPADVHCLGHHHQLRDFGRAVVNGSLIGYGPYSQRIRAEFEDPGQMMFYMDSERGKSMVTALWVDDVHKKPR